MIAVKSDHACCVISAAEQPVEVEVDEMVIRPMVTRFLTDVTTRNK
jgi:hypothetical protein